MAEAKPKKNPFQQEYGHFIGGEWVASESGETFEAINPATGEVLARVQAGNDRDVDRAVKAAQEAFATWGRTPAAEREQILLEIANRLEKRKEQFALMETLGNGKPIREPLFFDIPFCVDHYRYFAATTRMLNGETIPVGDDVVLIYHEPLGVVGQIIPWNAPLAMVALKLAPALAAGNTVVLKPAEQACLSVLEFVKEISDLVPRGVINVVTGFGPTAGAPLARHPGVNKVAFTGETVTGRLIIQYTSENIVPVTLELGGKSPFIVFPDCDLDQTIEGLALNLCVQAGQMCAQGSRVFVHEDIYDTFVEKAVDRARRIRIGDPTDPQTELGPLVSQEQLEKVLNYIEIGQQEGAKLLCGGGRPQGEQFAKGFYVEPTLFGEVKNSMRIAQEEIFGPVLGILRWRDYDRLIEEANDVIYGLAAGIWTSNLKLAHETARRLQAGMVWINRYYNFKSGAPIGGYKKSGFGREAALETVKYHYSQTKSVVLAFGEPHH
ncbi:MAG: aldehyde dehydrogenase family protein [Acidobacteria bacterium]|nr:MAG: aldehyde dehydrogenase family protein [Acidobacteriota bacterium]